MGARHVSQLPTRDPVFWKVTQVKPLKNTHTVHVPCVQWHDMCHGVSLTEFSLQCIDHPRILTIVESYLGRDLILGSLAARIVRPGDPEQRLHGGSCLHIRRRPCACMGCPVGSQSGTLA